jgi:hypothetical protein
VHDGVTHAAKLFPNAYVIMIAVGAIKECRHAYYHVVMPIANTTQFETNAATS